MLRVTCDEFQCCYLCVVSYSHIWRIFSSVKILLSGVGQWWDKTKEFPILFLAFQCSKNAAISLFDSHPVIHHIKIIIISSFRIWCIFGNLYYVFVVVQHECGRLISREWKQKARHQTIYKLHVLGALSLNPYQYI